MRSRILGLRRTVTAFQQIASPHQQISGPHQQISNPYYTPIRTYKVNQECDAHMNELPIPCGPWGPWYQAKQNFYNKVFVGGVLWFLFSFAMMIYTDSIYLNFSPPARPGPPSDMVIECDDSE